MGVSLLDGGQSTQGFMRSFVVISPKPFSGAVLDFLQATKQILSQPIIAYGPVVAFDVGILLRVARLGVDQRNAPLGGPIQQDFAHVFRPVVRAE